MTAVAAMPRTPPAAVERRSLVASDAQAKLSLGKMRHYVRGAIHDHEWIWFARHVIADSGVDGHDPPAIAQAIRTYVSQRVRYCADPLFLDDITPPLQHMVKLQAVEAAGPYAYLMGDCDKAATISAALAGAVGIPSTFTIRAFDWGRGPSPYQHVFTTLYPRGGPPVVCDTTRDPRQLPPTVQRDYTIAL